MHVGTSGWVYKHWKGTFYPKGLPAKSELDYYAERLDTVELNGSHYRWPKDETMAGYRDRLPEGFQMAVKASRYLSHYRKLNEPEEWCELITKTMDALGPKAGPLIVQLPSNFHRNDERLSHFLGLLPERILVAIEPQHESWLDEDVFALLDRHGAGFCISVIAEQEPVLRATGRLVYARFHNSDPNWRYGGTFDDATLAVWADRFRELTAGQRPAYVYFNNDNHGYAAFNAVTLKGMLGG